MLASTHRPSVGARTAGVSKNWLKNKSRRGSHCPAGTWDTDKNTNTQAGRAPIARPVGFITKLPHGRGSPCCYSLRRDQSWLKGRPNDLPLNSRWSVGAPAAGVSENWLKNKSRRGSHCPAGTWVNEPSARAWELGLLEKPTNRPCMGAGAALVAQSTGMVTAPDRKMKRIRRLPDISSPSDGGGLRWG